MLLCSPAALWATKRNGAMTQPVPNASATGGPPKEHMLRALV